VSGKNVLEEHSLFSNCHIIGLDNRYRQPSVDCLWSKAEAILILSLSPYIWGRGDFENTFRMSAKRSIYNYTKSIFDLI
jgi:hypothetical protein